MRTAALPRLRVCAKGAILVAPLAAVMALAAAGWSLTGRALPDMAESDRLSLLARLDIGDYEGLEAHLSDLQSRYENRQIAEAEVEAAFLAFAAADPEVAARLAAWAERRPDSFAGHLARGHHRRHLVRLSLSGGVQAAPDAAIPEAAKAALAEAREDLEAAIARHPKLGLAYAALIDLAMAENDGEQADRWFTEGLEAAPQSPALRRAYLLSLRPWLRPQRSPADLMAKLRKLAATEEDGDAANPELAALARFDAYVTAEVLRRQRRHSQATRYYRMALEAGGDWVILRGAGVNAHQRARNVTAIGFFSEALARRPEDPKLLDLRAHALWALGNADSALADWQRALILDPGDPHILAAYVGALRDQGRAKAALEAIDAAAPFAREHPRIRELRGRLLLSDLDRPREAADELRSAVVLAPHSGQSWRIYAEALYRLKDCDGAAGAIATFRRLCSNGVRCARDDLLWARQALSDTRDPNACPVYGVLGP